MRGTAVVAFVALAGAVSCPRAFAHCEVPCGIYDDPMRIEIIAESITTIEKSMRKIAELSAAKERNYNQIVRWVNTKDEHAEKIQGIVAFYFMAQRIKPPAAGDRKVRADYVEKLTLCHGMIVAAMKAKQGTDIGNVKRLRELLTGFQAAYFGEPGAAHH